MTLLDRIRSHPAVESVSDERGFEGGNLFINLRPEWEWSEQSAFGCDTATEAWRMVRQTKRRDASR